MTVRPDLGDLVSQLADLLADRLAEPVARRVVDLLRDGQAIDVIDQHSSPLGNRRHVALCRDGTLPHVKLGRRWCVRRADLDRYLGGASPAANDAASPAADPDAKLAGELGLRIVKPLSTCAPRVTGSKKGKP